MTIPLSKRTVRLADALFDEPLLAQLKETLVTSVGDTIPFCKNQTPEGVERIRFAVLKLVKNGGNVADLINGNNILDAPEEFCQ